MDEQQVVTYAELLAELVAESPTDDSRCVFCYEDIWAGPHEDACLILRAAEALGVAAPRHDATYVPEAEKTDAIMFAWFAQRAKAD